MVGTVDQDVYNCPLILVTAELKRFSVPASKYPRNTF